MTIKAHKHVKKINREAIMKPTDRVVSALISCMSEDVGQEIHGLQLMRSNRSLYSIYAVPSPNSNFCHEGFNLNRLN